MVYDIHILVCTNQRKDSDKRSCGEAHGLELVAEFKKQLKNSTVSLKTRANRSGCLGICDFGPTVVIYPRGTFYVNVQKDDVKDIVDAHLNGRDPIKRLLLDTNE
ncbi:MAG TPA: (2Fe-2S) ferredoxin domain-containing protein [Bacteroidia bacterium]|nr:(2Fe-2S) ferredoxin domain-containing protein [Bacteroidia bacterium]